MNAVALRVAPPRSGTGTKKPAGTAAKAQAPAPKPAQPAPTQPKAEPAPQTDDRSAMQKLLDRFK